MKIIKWILIVAVLGVFGVAVWRNLGVENAHEHQQKDVYYCPMHPSYTSSRPGSCPICSMALVKRKKETAVNDGMNDLEKRNDSTGTVLNHSDVHLDLRQRQLLGIRTAAVKEEQVTKPIYAIGYVAHNIDLYKVQNEFIEAYQAYVNVYKDYRRVGSRRKNWEIHRQLQTKVLEAEHSLVLLGLGQAQIDKLRNIKWWQSWDQPELEILQTNNNYWIFAQFFEQDLGFVEVGQKAVVEIPAYHEFLNGTVRSIGGYVDPQTRTVRALIEISGYRGELTANMLAYINIQSELGSHLVVPTEAVSDLGTRKIVFVERENGVFNPVEVRVGFQGNGYWAIHQGVKIGDKVVVSGNFLLDSESRLKAQFNDEGATGTKEVEHVHP